MTMKFTKKFQFAGFFFDFGFTLIEVFVMGYLETYRFLDEDWDKKTASIKKYIQKPA